MINLAIRRSVLPGRQLLTGSWPRTRSGVHPRTCSFRTLLSSTADDNSSSTSNSSGNKRLEYQHAFHAGNFADVFKHVMLVMLLQRMILPKNKSMSYVETHAGAGLYELADTSSTDYEKEHQRGVWQLLDLIHQKDPGDLPESVVTYLDIVRSFQVPQKEDAPTRLIYPGSPLFAASLLAKQQSPQTSTIQHSMHLYEKFPAPLDLLRHHLDEYLAATSNSNSIDTFLHCDDGYKGLTKYAQSTSSLPPRALILLDPPYQYGSDTDQIVATCRALRQHWRSARIVIWHPVRPDHADKLERLYRMLGAENDDEILAVEVYAPSSSDDDRKPDVGTGMIMIQPPYGMDTECQQVLPTLWKMLHPSSDAQHAIQIRWL
ncbi:protein involved in catabolism of external DNA [Seminavis robusta]|uniref:Protein involved in catabolism of external DNA n=1 Tax=Seminavis robusta TaxID=568900 RepID=A0A9N8E2X5_9STRA|nr:protein involved in catabolism of external DNA [Seminavis robusta]|eukprot:Sro602_g173670.1 protein involved in catabolism of external DNA (375) ;mRNA; f:15485-16609